MKLRSTLFILALFLASPFVAADQQQIDQLRAALSKKVPDLADGEIAETQIPGVLELLSGGQLYYLTPDANYMLEGNLIDLDKRINITAQRKGTIHISSINAMPEEKMVVYSPKNATREITVFTDTSCPYCSKLHAEIDKILDAGIKVRYLLYPRAGLNSAAFNTLQSVWCADDQQQAMTDAKLGKNIKSATCENPINEHIALAQQVGLRGTPLIYLDSGQMVNGYRPAEQLVEMIKGSSAVKKSK
jgi:thiol:disulfide interchange protein DsbC